MLVTKYAAVSTAQVGILLIFNLVTMLLIFPAVLSLDARRKKNYRVDVICCLEAAHSTKVTDISMLPPPSPPSYNGSHSNTVAFAEPSSK